MADLKNRMSIIFCLEASDQAEGIVNVIKNTGVAVAMQMVASKKDLAMYLGKNTWDIIVSEIDSKIIDPQYLLSGLNNLDSQIGVIFLSDDISEESKKKALEMGAKDIVSKQNIELIAMLVKREFSSVFAHRLASYSEKLINEESRRCRLLLDNSQDAVAYMSSGMHVYANKNYLKLFGYSDIEEIESVPVLDLIAPKDQVAFKAFIKKYPKKFGVNKQLEITAVLAEEIDRPVEFFCSYLVYESEPCIQMIVRSQGQVTADSNQAPSDGTKDIVTGAYSRKYFIEMLQNCIAQAKKDNLSFIFYYIKINGLSELELDIGASGLDSVLSSIAALIKKIVPQNSVIAHFSDDVFSVLVESNSSLNSLELGERVCSKIMDYMPEYEGKTIQLSVRIGMVDVNEVAESAEQIIHDGHEAADHLLENKQHRGVYYLVPANQIDFAASKEERIRLEKAIEQGLFKILFQPIISLRGQTRPFYEVVLRMLNDQGEEISPHEFLKTAIENKMTEKIDRWVMVQAIKALSNAYLNGIETQIIINITVQTLCDRSFVGWLGAALNASKLPPDSLVFQFTEGEATTYLKQAWSATKLLSDLGCKVSLARFGQAAEPFKLLKHLSVDYVKLDGSLAKSLNSQEDLGNLKNLVNKAHNHGKITIASFVDEVAVLTSLYTVGMHYIQGYYIQPPSEHMDYDFEEDEENL